MTYFTEMHKDLKEAKSYNTHFLASAACSESGKMKLPYCLEPILASWLSKKASSTCGYVIIASSNVTRTASTQSRDMQTISYEGGSEASPLPVYPATVDKIPGDFKISSAGAQKHPIPKVAVRFADRTEDDPRMIRGAGHSGVARRNVGKAKQHEGTLTVAYAASRSRRGYSICLIILRLLSVCRLDQRCNVCTSIWTELIMTSWKIEADSWVEWWVELLLTRIFDTLWYMSYELVVKDV